MVYGGRWVVDGWLLVGCSKLLDCCFLLSAVVVGVWWLMGRGWLVGWLSLVVGCCLSVVGGSS